MEQLQGMDSSFVALEQPNAPMHIGSILIYDPSTAPGSFVRFKDILRFTEDRLSLSKTMRRRLVRVPFNIDYPYWVEDEDFDLEYHIRHVALPKPGDWRQLCIQAARIFARPLDLSRPPWEMTVIEGLDNIEGVPKGSYATVTKVHHAAIDGMSGIDMMQALHTPMPTVAPPNEPDMWKPERRPSSVGMFAKGYARAWINPFRQLGVAAQSAPGMFRAAKGMVKREFDLSTAIRTPRTRFNVKISPNRVVEGRTFELADIKAIRALSEGCKVNDVLLAIIGGGLRKYLIAKGELPKTSLTAMAPISVRSDSEKNTMGNQVSAMIAPLGTHIADAAERLQYVHAETQKSKAMTNAIGARQMTEASKVSPALFMALGAQLYTRLGIADHMKPVVNTVVTNVPGPPIPIYSAGAQMVSMHGLLCLLDGMALGHVVQSYVNQATIGFTACRKALPDPEFYSECLQDSFEDFALAAGLELFEDDEDWDAAEEDEVVAAPAPAKPAPAKPARTKSATPKAAAKPKAASARTGTRAKSAVASTSTAGKATEKPAAKRKAPARKPKTTTATKTTAKSSAKAPAKKRAPRKSSTTAKASAPPPAAE